MHLLLAFVTIIVASRLLSAALRRAGQPGVVGEIIAGIALGPSFLGAVAPKVQAFAMPAPVVGQLGVVAQMGIIFFMFLIGVDLDKTSLKTRSGRTFAIAVGGIVVPFALGCAQARLLYPLSNAMTVPFVPFALFIGIAMSVTAFPVLARILAESGLLRTTLGVVALGCAAVGDLLAWCLLAIVEGLVRSEKSGSFAMLLGTIAYIGAMLCFARPIVGWLARVTELAGAVSRKATASLLVGVLASALVTQAIGLHALFGAFVLGAMIPRGSLLANEILRKFENIVTVLLLPAFFALTGLRTQIGLLHGLTEIFMCVCIIVVACLGKFGGTALAARVSGHSWRHSYILGILMNARGLMELIVLNVGLDLGILSSSIFTMFVVMALVTTIAAGPLLRLVHSRKTDGSVDESCSAERRVGARSAV